jgi:peptidoglycan-N-acetylglucosamine deacetylase
MRMDARVSDMPAAGDEPARRPLSARIARRAFRIASRRLLGTITHVRTSEPVAALTFDDGPDPQSTPVLLDVLARHGARATFFLLGKHARRYPDIVARIAQAGHAVANHTFDHPCLPSLARRERLAQIKGCEAAIRPHGSKLFRPPRGLQSVASRLDALMLGYRVITWNVVLYDWERHPPEWFASRLEAETRPGSIVLLHDLLYEADDPAAADRRPVFAGLDMFLTRAGTRLSFVTVPDLLTRGRPGKASWFVRTDADWALNAPG